MRFLATALIAFVVALVALGPACVPSERTAVRTRINGLPVDVGQLGGLSCSSIGIGHRPSQSDIDLCKKFLPEKDGKALQILWEEFDEVVTDGVHSLRDGQQVPYTERTCPILALYPIQHGHETGAISDQEFADRLYAFYREKYKQDLNGHQERAKARLRAAGLPIP